MASYQIRQRDPLLDQNMQAVLERRGRELLGMGLLALALCFALLLGSYTPDDPGWMVATDQEAQNLLGRFGAAVASTLMIIGGKGVWGIPVVLAAWGVRYVTHRGEDRALSRVVFAVIAVALASVYAATHVPGAAWPHSFGLGGLFGDTVLGAALGVAPVQAGFGLKIMSLMSGAALVAMGLFVTGFDGRELRGIGRFLLVGLVVTYAAAMKLAGQGATGTARAAATLQDGLRTRAIAALEARAARTSAPAFEPAPGFAAAPASRAGNRAAAPAPAPVVAEPRRSVLRRAAEPPVAAPAAPDPAGFGRPVNLRAEPRYPDADPQPAPREKLGLLARMPGLMRRVVEPELVEPGLSAHAYDANLPSEDRIKARINDVIRSRVRNGSALATPMSVIQAAVARREPPVARLRGPQPLIADTRRGVPMALPPEPPVVAPAPVAAPRSMTPVLTATRAATPPLAALQATGAVLSRVAQPPLRAPQPQVWADEDDEGLTEDVADAADLTDIDDSYRADVGPPYGIEEDEPDYDPTPVLPRPMLAAEPRRVVQTAARKPVPLSRKAAQEAQPRLKFEEPAPVPAYELPPLNLLSNPATIQRHQLSEEALEENARMLENVLDDYGVKGEIVSVRPGPVVTMYELEPAPGLKASRVIGLADDIARSMSALSARVSTVPGRTVIGIELPNVTREKVVLREILSARDFGDSAMRLPLALGKDIGGEPIVANLAKMPHLLIAGTTGSGKSVAINTMILSLLYKLSPEECRLIMIDPKMLELSVYDGIPHLLSPVVTDPKKAVVALKWVVAEMEERYRKMSRMGVRNIEGYNGRVREAIARGELFKRTIQTGFDDDTGEPVFETDEFQPVTIPYIVVVVDEMADLMMVAGKEIEACIQRLAQMARASGIHLIMATQRPSVDVITGTIKANFPTRISFQVTSKIDSRTILGEQGAEQLLGMGDMLYMAGGAKITRIHGPFVSDEEVEEIVNHLKSYGPPTYMSGVVEGVDDDKADDIDLVLGLGGDSADDSLYDQAVAVVAKDRKCSTSYIQRKLGIGYNKAARLVEQMEENHVVTTANHVGKREILLPEQ
ncbi:DNA translocase FtsK [Paracoccaceae bacterium Fryx2]|nr:DNA translocase FtsK [Paracoccaceae bacterium Fryx2]